MTVKPTAAPTAATRINTLPKKIVSLKILLERSLNTMEAMTLYGETALHSTISELVHRHDLKFDRVSERHMNRVDRSVYFVRYTLAEESKKAALSLIKVYENKRKRA